jgi:hypothetical protein
MVIKEAAFELDLKKQGRNTLVSAEAGSSASGNRLGQGHNLFGLADTMKQGSGGWHFELSQERALCPGEWDFGSHCTLFSQGEVLMGLQ